MKNYIKKMEFTITVVVILFWIAIAEIVAGLVIFIFSTDSLQKMTNAFAILCLGIVASLLCYRTCNTINSAIQSEIFDS